jgi:hypothetical protein
MRYESVDRLQKLLADEVFHYTADAKKAAGRALGTLVEIITFYLLKSWNFHDSIAIETSLPEYGNPDITHNVEFSLHPILRELSIDLSYTTLPFTSSRIVGQLPEELNPALFHKVGTTLLTKDGILRNACTIAVGDTSHLVATLTSQSKKKVGIGIVEQHLKPYAIFECKRVGVEEGMKKGPQTIEKAKQGAYVARAVSSLQKIRTASGELHGLVHKPDKTIYSKPYSKLLSEIVASSDRQLLNDFILTVGIVSNHGNWFTSANHNKELKVLAQSYDWLLFLTDDGLAEFITELLLKPVAILKPARDAFLVSYAAKKLKNRFTKVQMDLRADSVLRSYFVTNVTRIKTWFNIIAPMGGTINNLKAQMDQLRSKDWAEIHST